jgi:hypothetical protein
VHSRERGPLAQRRQDARFEIVAIEQIVRVERDQARVHDVDARLLHRAQVERVRVDEPVFDMTNKTVALWDGSAWRLVSLV